MSALISYVGCDLQPMGQIMGLSEDIIFNIFLYLATTISPQKIQTGYYIQLKIMMVISETLISGKLDIAFSFCILHMHLLHNTIQSLPLYEGNMTVCSP